MPQEALEGSIDAYKRLREVARRWRDAVRSVSFQLQIVCVLKIWILSRTPVQIGPSVTAYWALTCSDSRSPRWSPSSVTAWPVVSAAHCDNLWESIRNNLLNNCARHNVCPACRSSRCPARKRRLACLWVKGLLLLRFVTFKLKGPIQTSIGRYSPSAQHRALTLTGCGQQFAKYPPLYRVTLAVFDLAFKTIRLHLISCHERTFLASASIRVALLRSAPSSAVKEFKMMPPRRALRVDSIFIKTKLIECLNGRPSKRPSKLSRTFHIPSLSEWCVCVFSLDLLNSSSFDRNTPFLGAENPKKLAAATLGHSPFCGSLSGLRSYMAAN